MGFTGQRRGSPDPSESERGQRYSLRTAPALSAHHCAPSWPPKPAVLPIVRHRSIAWTFTRSFARMASASRRTVTPSYVSIEPRPALKSIAFGQHKLRMMQCESRGLRSMVVRTDFVHGRRFPCSKFAKQLLRLPLELL